MLEEAADGEGTRALDDEAVLLEQEADGLVQLVIITAEHDRPS